VEPSALVAFVVCASAIWIAPLRSLSRSAGRAPLQALVPARAPASMDAVAGSAGALVDSKAATFRLFTKK
jgi:hypothetical protein